MELTLERDVLLTQQSIDDRDALVEALAALVEAHPEPLELVGQEGARAKPTSSRPPEIASSMPRISTRDLCGVS